MWHHGEKPLNYRIRIIADDRVCSARHADIADEGSALGQDPRIDCADMGMSTEHSADSTIQIPSQGHFLCGSFTMEVDQNDRWPGINFFKQTIHSPKRAIEVPYKDTPHKADYHRFLCDQIAMAWHARRHIQRAQDTWLVFNVWDYLLMVPDMMPEVITSTPAWKSS